LLDRAKNNIDHNKSSSTAPFVVVNTSETNAFLFAFFGTESENFHRSIIVVFCLKAKNCVTGKKAFRSCFSGHGIAR